MHRRGDAAEYAGFRARMQEQFSATGGIRAPAETFDDGAHGARAAGGAAFQARSVFRLQNFETHALLLDGTALQTEPLAFAGARRTGSGRVSLMVMEYGASARLVGAFQPGDPVLLMGPTGVRAKIPGGG